MRCEDSRLLRLLESDDNTDRVCQETSEHLETCDACRRRLEALAGEPPWWNELTATLSDCGWDSADGEPTQGSGCGDSIVVALEPSLQPDMPAACDVVSLDFLEPPRHPELLGHLGRYNVERVVGSGGMGVVLKAFDTELHRYVAVKVLAPHLAGSGAARMRFAREAQAAAAVAHQNVMPIHDVQTEYQMPFLVMPLVTGRSLQAWVDQQGPLTVEESLRVLQQAASALAAAHAQGIVHRDVKPANILIEEGGRVLLSDFGLARAVDDAGMTRTGFAAGTPHYMSPEQAMGDRVDLRSDLYGLGSVFYFMLCGSPPHTQGGILAVLHAICHEPHRPISQRRDGLSDEVAALSSSLLARLPEQRPHDATAVRDICEHLIRQRRFHAEPPALPQRRPPESWPAIHLGARVALALLLVVGALFGLGAFDRFGTSPALSPTENEGANDLTQALPSPGSPNDSGNVPQGNVAPSIAPSSQSSQLPEAGWLDWETHENELPATLSEVRLLLDLWSDPLPSSLDSSVHPSDVQGSAMEQWEIDWQTAMAQTQAHQNDLESDLESAEPTQTAGPAPLEAWIQSMHQVEADAYLLRLQLNALDARSDAETTSREPILAPDGLATPSNSTPADPIQ